MGKLAVFVERYTIARAEELEALLRFKQAAERHGHELHYLFRPELRKIPRFDAVFLRALTDPLNASYVAARLAELHGIPVIDDSHSIRICCDKVAMYRQMQRAGVAIPETRVLRPCHVTHAFGERLLAELGAPLILKAPHSSFSSHVEKVDSPEDFVATGHRFLYRADRIVAQAFVESAFDWRVGVLDGKPLYTCRYGIAANTFKVQAVVNGHLCYGRVESVPVEDAPEAVVRTGIAAARAIGNGLYGVDLKVDRNGHVVVIEVNDNPTINAGDEDVHAPDLYERIVLHLLERRAPAANGYRKNGKAVRSDGSPIPY